MSKRDTYAIMVMGEDGAYQGFGPFHNYDKARVVFDKLMAGASENVLMLSVLEPPTEENLAPWLKQWNDEPIERDPQWDDQDAHGLIWENEA